MEPRRTGSADRSARSARGCAYGAAGPERRRSYITLIRHMTSTFALVLDWWVGGGSELGSVQVNDLFRALVLPVLSRAIRSRHRFARDSPRPLELAMATQPLRDAWLQRPRVERNVDPTAGARRSH